jgi:hypothetical protein
MAPQSKTQATDSLARAIEILNAVEVAPGRYAYRDDATRRYYVSSEADLCRLAGYLDGAADDGATTGDAYSRWCADTLSTEMPSWWSPQQRFAYRATDACEVCAGFANQRPMEDPRDAADVPESHWERITADLTTGEEVPA